MDQKTERNSLIIVYREKGQTYPEIARRFGISTERIRQICRIHEHMKKRKPHWQDGLSIRSLNCILNAFWSEKESLTKERVIDLIKSGRLYKGATASSHGAGKIRNFGKKCYLEVCKWAGQSHPPYMDPGHQMCPHCGKDIIIR